MHIVNYHYLAVPMNIYIYIYIYIHIHVYISLSLLLHLPFLHLSPALLGKNYREHVSEIAIKNADDARIANKDATKSATFFTKAPECVIGMYP